MPGINGGALKAVIDIAETFLNAKIGEENQIEFKNGTMVFKRIS